MKAHFRTLMFLCVLLTVPTVNGWASPDQLYVLNRLGGTVSVVDTATDKIIQTISIPYPRGAAFSPDGKLAYISSEDEHTLDVVDRKTGQIMKKVPLSGHPAGNLAMTKDGRYIFIGLTPFLDLAIKHKDPKDSGGEDIIDTSTLTRIKTIPIIEGIHDTFLTPDGKYVILGADTGTFAAVVDVQTMEIAWKIPFDRSVLTMAIESGPDGSTSRLFVELKNLNGFAVVDFAQHKEVARIDLPDSMKYQFAGGFRPDGTVQFNPTHGTAISPDRKWLWVCSRATNTAYIYSLPDLKLANKLEMPVTEKTGQPVQAADPHWTVFTHNGKKIYICLAAIDQVIAYDTHTLKEVSRFDVGTRPTVIEIALGM